MKNILLLILASIFLTTEMFAITYYADIEIDSNKEYKFSEIKWVDAGREPANPLRGVPGKSDTAYMREVTTVIVDKDTSFKTLELNGKNNFEIHGAKLSVEKANACLAQFDYGSSTTIAAKKGATVDIKNYSATGRGMLHNLVFGYSSIDAHDAVVNIHNIFEFTCGTSDSFITNSAEKGGVALNLRGNGKINIKGPIILDPIVDTASSKMELLFYFREENGNVPEITLHSPVSNIYNTRVKVRLSQNAKPGKYPLVTFLPKGKQITGSFSPLSVNNRTTTMGSELEVLGKKVKIYMGVSPTDKDKETKNDLILEILK